MLVEDTANGQAVIQLLRANIASVVAITPQGGKGSRIVAASAGWQAGDWYVDRNAAWVEPFVEQITMFPNADHDDQVDAMTQAAWLSENNCVVPTVRSTNAFTSAINWEY